MGRHCNNVLAKTAQIHACKRLVNGNETVDGPKNVRVEQQLCVFLFNFDLIRICFHPSPCSFPKK